MTTINLSPTHDSYVDDSVLRDSINYGSDAVIKIYDYTNSAIWALLKFDLSTLEGTINSADIYLYYKDESSAAAPTKAMDVHKITSDWDEAIVTWDNKPSYTAVATSSTTLGSEGTWRTFDVKTDVQAVVDGTPDYGWFIKFQSETGDPSSPDYDSKESADTVHRPYLLISLTGYSESEEGETVPTTSPFPRAVYISGYQTRLYKNQIVGYHAASGDLRAIETTSSGHVYVVEGCTPMLVTGRVATITAASGGESLCKSGFWCSGLVLKQFMVKALSGEIWVGYSGCPPYIGWGYSLHNREEIKINKCNLCNIYVAATTSGSQVGYLGE